MFSCTALDYLGGNRPLSEEERGKLRRYRDFFVNNMTLKDNILNKLFSQECISERQLAGIRQPGCESHQIGVMLDIIERRSYAQYRIFYNLLRPTQEDVARVIESTGGNLCRVYSSD